jgi:hypothetical protein
MAKSVFRACVERVRRDWKTRFPWVRPADETYVPAMPKASTFYAGSANRFSKHLFLHLQHHSKPWAVGDMTVNVIISSRLGAPEPWSVRLDLEPNPEGSHRIGILVHGEDKWWCLSPNDSIYAITWRPTTYADPEAVLDGAVADLSKDVHALFALLQAAR